MLHLSRFIAVFLLGAGLSLGQSTFGAILGRITDPSGAPQVKAANRDTNVTVAASTNEMATTRLVICCLGLIGFRPFYLEPQRFAG